ncbi:MAG: hypothetical protein A3F31_01615 [Candidatus Levybacteria bacterium RIFCSPHIGHO2_12_FULL_38_12]|nr:MAG: hypothetical protein A2770_01145 [Candidatus Levybacteria bacterium RIFCSPHIGHO2_01_FULL_38_12]OGH22906.1 MAG: hypothetical protein A3F31_01615 [Candidatus Levybacteria bacterium RIFCSPHIGHO2_12_FULL_38_12]OGH34022.1 MAG: hypothetical protein A3A47_04855 [Candidatus Levybacteria bacterium RIFCSPLOWO2_01_FULL_37_20]OGH44830.1 MAG: hypothetical protein A3J14_05390 [Candidatus Levybacteria bacterium RIFCSPLOWO2_02_FULL_37_18]
MVVLFLLFILGICVGSFLHVLIDRIPREQTIIKGRSYCESCKKVLKWYDLIPLFSYVQLWGKCRYCHTSLSYYYPVVELVTGVMFVTTSLFLPIESITYQVLSIRQIFLMSYYLFTISSLIVIFFADLKYGIIPDKILFPLIVITLIGTVIPVCPYPSFRFVRAELSVQNPFDPGCGRLGDLTRMMSGIGSFLFFLLLFVFTKGKGMGFGDVKFAFFMGLFLGFPKILIALYIAFLTGACISIILLIGGKKKLKSTIPFGPFLVIGTMVSMFFGDKMIMIFRLF